jgi:hypothetical protein
MKHIFTLIIGVFIHTQIYSQSVPSYVPTNGLVGWWGFNGNAQDGSGNGNHGTVNGATLTTDRFGNQNGAYSFDGDDDYILANAVSLDNVFGNPYDVTVSVWFYYMDSLLTINNGHPPIGHQLIGQGTRHNPTAYCDFAIGATRFNGTSQFAFEKSENPHPNHSMNYFQNNFQNNTWYHVVFTFNSGQGYFYLNGQIAGSFFVNPFLNGVFENCGQTLSFGSRYVENSLTGNPVCNFLLGKLDDIGIWNRVLNTAEITNLYNSQSCQVNISSQPISQTAVQNSSIKLNITSSHCNYSIKWQVDSGFGFYNLTDSGLYSGSATDTLTITGISNIVNGHSFRCIISTQDCGKDTSNIATINVVVPNILTGTLQYSNLNSTPLSGIPIHLKSYIGFSVLSDTTDSLGVFTLSGYPNGNYFLDADINYDVNSVNSSDALLTQRFVVLLETLTNLQQKSADVSGNQRIASTDALMISLMSAGVIGQFPVDRFVNTQPNITATGGLQNVQILALAAGDVNGSLIVHPRQPILVLDSVYRLGEFVFAVVSFPFSGSGVFERGICWDTIPEPTIQDNHTNLGTGGFGFSHTFRGLNIGETYFVRGYAINSLGVVYSNEMSFVDVSTPEVITYPATGITSNSANVESYVVSDGGLSITQRGVVYDTISNPTLNSLYSFNGLGLGNYTSTLTGLSPSTTYYVRAYATNSLGTAYGNEVNFATNPAALPSIGSYYAGGIVFFLDSTGLHGLVCSPNDLGYFEWGCFGLSIPCDFSTSIGSGMSNTNQILSGCSQRPIAASVCADLVLNGFDDWFLPSYDESLLMINHLNYHQNWYGLFGAFWSSSQDGAYNAAQLCDDYTPWYYCPSSKNNGYRVRAVRAF